MASRPFTREEVSAFLAQADAILAAPPARPWIERHPGRGRLGLRFALPLAMVQTEDCGRRRAQAWQLTRARSAVLATMASQMCDQLRGPDGRIATQLRSCPNGRGVLPVWPAPLTGRPQVRCVRFSAVAPDHSSGWQKTALDCLLQPRTHAGRRTAALGVLADDRPSLLEVRDWWEAAPKGQGGALIEVWSGTEAHNGSAEPSLPRQESSG
jgi:hypothetical protein